MTGGGGTFLEMLMPSSVSGMSMLSMSSSEESASDSSSAEELLSADERSEGRYSCLRGDDRLLLIPSLLS